jgi:16S rRNA (cytidine1402-2'-O)-methyltransferase
MADTGLTEAALYVVATPIGNLGDITLRAMEVLRQADAIAAEDTRVTQKLLAHLGIRSELMSLHEHNEKAAAQRIVELLGAGKRVALVSDAGTPGLSDPGAAAVAAVRAAGFRAIPVPGASAMLAALAVSGMTALPVCFHGFLPSRKAEREKWLRGVAGQQGVLVFYEAPHRIVESVAAIAEVFGGDRRILIARELTKLFEQVHDCRLDEAVAWLQADADRQRGEFVLLVEGAPAAAGVAEAAFEPVLEALLEELPLRQAVSLAAKITGARRNAVYERALELKNADD